MTTEVGQTSVTPIPTHSRDTPLHFDSDLGFESTSIQISEALREVEGPIYHIPKDATIVDAKPEEIRDFFLPPRYSEHEIKLRTEAAVEYGFDYLRRSDLKFTTGLVPSDFKRPLLMEANEAAKKAVREFRMASSEGKLIGAALQPENLVRVSKLLRNLRERCLKEILDDGLAVPEPPFWGKINNPQQWWSLNDYEIMAATFLHEVGAFLKVYSPYLPKEELKPEPATPRRSTSFQPIVSGPLTPKKPKNVTFPEAPQISSITSSTRLGAMISNAPKDSSGGQYPPRQSWDVSRADPEDVFNKPESSEEIISTVRGSREPPTPPSDSSDSGDISPREDGGPPRPPPLIF